MYLQNLRQNYIIIGLCLLLRHGEKREMAIDADLKIYMCISL